MRFSVWVSQAVGSTEFILPVGKSGAMVPHVRPPPSDPAKELFFIVTIWGIEIEGPTQSVQATFRAPTGSQQRHSP